MKKNLLLVGFILFVSMANQPYNDLHATFIEQVQNEIERKVCADSQFPVLGWELVSSDSDKGTNGVMGRTTCIYVDEQNDPTFNTVYVGTENSGLWKTENFSEKMPKWICLTEASRFPGVGVVDIAVNSKNPDEIFIATAIGVSFEWEYGLSILRTRDGGATWLESNLSQNLKPSKETIAQRIMITKSKRQGKSNLIALCDKAIYNSINGGLDFSKVAALRDFEGGNSNYYYNDLVLQPQYANVLYASSVDQFLENGGARLLISKDKGDSWEDISHVLTENFDPEKSTTNFIRIDLAVSPSNPKKLFLYGVTKSKERKLYVIDFQEEFNPKTTIFTNNQGIGSFWMSDIEVSRVNPNKIYLGRIYSWVLDLSNSKTGEIRATHHANGTTIHSDKRDYYIVGDENEEKLFCANDGGVAVYQKNQDGKYEWINKTGNGLAITQFYGLGVSVAHKVVAGGAQDLGGFIYGKENKNYRCGDGYQCEIDDESGRIYIGFNSNVAVYPTSSFCGKVGLPIGRNDSKFKIGNNNLIGAGFATGNRGDQVLDKGKRGNFVFLYNPEKEQYLEIENYPYDGENAIISKKDFETGLQRVSAIAVASSNKNVFYLSGNRKEANKNRLWRIELAEKGPVEWTNLYTQLKYAQYRLAPWQLWQSISAIEVDHVNENTIWIAFKDNLHEGSHKVAFHPNTTDITDNSKWVFIDAGLPDFPVNYLKQDSKTGHLYAATDVGVYVNLTPSSHTSIWQCFNNTLPVIKVTDIEIDSDEIYISTYGRGIWKAKCL